MLQGQVISLGIWLGRGFGPGITLGVPDPVLKTMRNDVPPMDTSQQGAGEANLLHLRDTDREHRVKGCVLAPLSYSR